MSRGKKWMPPEVEGRIISLALLAQKDPREIMRDLEREGLGTWGYDAVRKRVAAVRQTRDKILDSPWSLGALGLTTTGLIPYIAPAEASDIMKAWRYGLAVGHVLTVRQGIWVSRLRNIVPHEAKLKPRISHLFWWANCYAVRERTLLALAAPEKDKKKEKKQKKHDDGQSYSVTHQIYYTTDLDLGLLADWEMPLAFATGSLSYMPVDIHLQRLFAREIPYTLVFESAGAAVAYDLNISLSLRDPGSLRNRLLAADEDTDMCFAYILRNVVGRMGADQWRKLRPWQQGQIPENVWGWMCHQKLSLAQKSPVWWKEIGNPGWKRFPWAHHWEGKALVSGISRETIEDIVGWHLREKKKEA